jgi:hypothetical protein
MSLLSQLKELRHKYLETNSAYLRTPIYLYGGIPLADDPDKPTRKTLIPHYVIWHHMPDPVYEVPEAEYRTPDGREADEREADMVDDDLLA